MKINKVNIEEIEVCGVDDIAPGYGNAVVARIGGDEVGKIVFYANVDYEGDVVSVTPHTANVDEEYRHQGVGTRIIQEVAQVYHIYAKNVLNNITDNKDDIHYTDEGLSFIRACEGKGYLKCDGDESNYDEYDDYGE